MRGNAHVRFGGADRGNGSPETAKPRPGPTLSYLKAGLGTEKACLLVLIGADTEGQKHLLALREGYRESTESWGEPLKDCRQRGLNEPACWIAAGALGLWAAVNEHSPRSAKDECGVNQRDGCPRINLHRT